MCRKVNAVLKKPDSSTKLPDSRFPDAKYLPHPIWFNVYNEKFPLLVFLHSVTSSHIFFTKHSSIAHRSRRARPASPETVRGHLGEGDGVLQSKVRRVGGGAWGGGGESRATLSSPFPICSGGRPGGAAGGGGGGCVRREGI